MGALEVDRYGNVNAHRGPGAYAGIGGFANITAKTPTVVFCLTFNTKGLSVYREGENITVEQNGAVPKFVQTVRSISFSARNAIKNGQKVLYITERCVFILTARGSSCWRSTPASICRRISWIFCPSTWSCPTAITSDWTPSGERRSQ